MVTWARLPHNQPVHHVDTIREFTKDDPTLSSDRVVFLDQPGGTSTGTAGVAG